MAHIKDYYLLNEDDIRKVQKIELNILKHFLRVCDLLNLNYYLHGGTMLGAVLYKGFIPWDDDIDISMPRSDYEMFLKEGQKYLPPQLFIQTCYNDNEYTLCFAKIRDLTTIFVEYSLQNRKKMKNGVFIDIFPIDGVNDKKKNIYVKMLRRRIDMSYWDVEYCSFVKKIIICIYVFPLLFISANKATRLLDKYRQKISIRESDNPALMLINRWYYPSSFYIPVSHNIVSFCGMNVNVVRDPGKWLRIDYPNYHIIPPKDKQKPGHKVVEHKFND